MANAACILSVLGMVLSLNQICKAYSQHKSGKVFWLCWFVSFGLLLMVGIIEVLK